MQKSKKLNLKHRGKVRRGLVLRRRTMSRHLIPRQRRKSIRKWRTRSQSHQQRRAPLPMQSAIVARLLRILLQHVNHKETKPRSNILSNKLEKSSMAPRTILMRRIQRRLMSKKRNQLQLKQNLPMAQTTVLNLALERRLSFRRVRTTFSKSYARERRQQANSCYTFCYFTVATSSLIQQQSIFLASTIQMPIVSESVVTTTCTFLLTFLERVAVPSIQSLEC
mmetsp:Transcript_22499/g.40889  ORF Transcript_22499/g.40889 Transcript_22499/m.40889 type:complete len:223 (+) Transcript_22499:2263-2931(+)